MDEVRYPHQSDGTCFPQVPVSGMASSPHAQARHAPPSPAASPAPGVAFRDLYDEHFSYVWRSLRRLGVPERDLPDATQDVFVVVHRQLPGFEGRSKLSTWLFRICFHIARARARRAHVRREVFDSACDPLGPDLSAEQALDQQRDLRLLGEALDAMELENRAVFTLFELERFSGREIAEALGLPLGTVYSKLRKARSLVEARFRRAGRGERAERSVGVRR